MEKDRNKFLVTLTLLTCLLGYLGVFSQDTASYKKTLLGHWISYYGYRQDTLVYIPYNSPLAETISPELRYGGLSFGEGNKYRIHYWKMCGNDNSPGYYQSNWYLSKTSEGVILSMQEINHQAKTYAVVEITDNRIVLVPFP